MTDLAGFLLARISEDEQLVRYASGRAAEWVIEDRAPSQWGDNEDDEVILGGGKPLAVCSAEYGGFFVADHIARHDPARVLAECDAKRRIIRDYQHDVRDYQAGYINVQPPNRTMKHLAVPYADHPEFREEWKP